VLHDENRLICMHDEARALSVPEAGGNRFYLVGLCHG